MNAGKDYRKARAHAQANADADGQPRWLHQYQGVWWISTQPLRHPDGRELASGEQTFIGCSAEKISPRTAAASQPRFAVTPAADRAMSHKPTHVVDNANKDPDHPAGPLPVVRFAPHLPLRLRQTLAERVASELNKAEPVLLTAKQLDKLSLEEL